MSERGKGKPGMKGVQSSPVFLRDPPGYWREGNAKVSDLAPQGLCVPGLRLNTCAAPYLSGFLTEKVSSDIRASRAGGDVIKTDSTGPRGPVRMWL